MTKRRRLLRLGGIGLVTGLAGCTDILGGSSDSNEDDDDGGSSDTNDEQNDDESKSPSDSNDEGEEQEASGQEEVVVDGTWSHRGNAANTALSPEAMPPKEDPTSAWSVEIGGYALLPSLHNGTVYVGNANEQLYAVDAVSGDVEWSTETGLSNAIIEPTDKAVFASPGASGSGLMTVDPRSGEELWSLDIDLDAPPVAVNDSLLIPASGSLVRVDATTGDNRTEIFSLSTEFGRLSHPAVTSGMTFFASNSRLLAVDLADGTVVWEVPFASETEESRVAPTVAGEGVYTVDSDAAMAVDADSGEQLWRTTELSPKVSGPQAVDDNLLYVAAETSAADGLVALDRNDGTIRWETDTENVVGHVVANETIFIGEQAGSSSGGGLRALAAADGSERWTWAPLSGNGAAVFDPIPAGNALFVTTRDNSLYALTSQ